MFLRRIRQQRRGQTYTYYSLVESVRSTAGRVQQRTICYLGRLDTKTGKGQRWDLPTYSGPYTSSKPDSKGRVYAPSNMAERLYGPRIKRKRTRSPRLILETSETLPALEEL